MKHVYLIIILVFLAPTLIFSEEEKNIESICFQNADGTTNDSSGDYYISVGIGYSILKNFFKAEQCFKEAIELNIGLFETYYNLGQVYYKTWQFDDAIENFTKAISIKPLYSKAYLYRGLAYSMKFEQIEEDTSSLRQEYLKTARDNYRMACNLESVYACEIIENSSLEYKLHPDPDYKIIKYEI